MSVGADANDSTARAEAVVSAKPVAVIDVGTSSIRMAIAEITPDGDVRTLETLSRGVNLGKDAFKTGVIQKSTIEECVRVLRSYRRRLTEYQITHDYQVRIVATSAVREATNRLAFLDRIYIATGLDVVPIDEAEVNRITFLGIQPFLNAEPELAAARNVIAEVGGGNTEVLIVQNGEVMYSHTYRLGSLRIRQTLETYRAPKVKLRRIMESQIERIVEQFAAHVPPESATELVALGGDVRFAASSLLPDWNPDRLSRLPLSQFENFTNSVLDLSVDELVQKYHLTFPDAEAIGPALLTYLHMARALRLDHVLVTKFSLRDGLLNEMAAKGVWTDDFKNQVVRSAVELGKKYEFDEPHSRHVANLSQELFRSLADDHQLEQRYELILYLAALLHEIGLFISNRSYHKHSMYVINNSELFGLSQRDLLLVGLVARYHRRASPKPNHQGYATLDREGRVAVTKMAAILRVADALDHSHSQRVQEIKCHSDDGRLVIAIPQVEDLSLEQLALKQKGPLFEEIFGMQVHLRRTRSTGG